MEDKFDISYCFFYSQVPGTVLETIEQNNFFHHEEMKNLHHFFVETGAHYVQSRYPAECPKNEVLDKIYSEVCVEDLSPWNCHHAGPYFARQTSEAKLYFGFTHQKMRDTKRFEFVFMHSFIVKDGLLLDPTIEVHAIQEKDWVSRNLWAEGRNIRLDEFGYYFGVEIPTFIASSIADSGQPRGVENLWGYLRHAIFHSKEKTDWFIDVIKKKGEGWVFQDYPIKEASK